MTTQHDHSPAFSLRSVCPAAAAGVGRVRALLGRAALPSALLAIVACHSNEPAPAPAPAVPSAAPAAPAAAAPSAPEPAAAAALAAAAPVAAKDSSPSIYGFTMKRLDGTETSLSAWSNKVLLIVNTASKCGYTPQYEGLQKLRTKYASRGFEVLGFPSNDFGGQEPGTSQEIATFCTSIYAVSFPMFEKSDVIGEKRNPLFALLSDAHGAPKWNFHKYLIDKHGKPVQAWPSAVVPGAPEIASAIEAQLAAN